MDTLQIQIYERPSIIHHQHQHQQQDDELQQQEESSRRNKHGRKKKHDWKSISLILVSIISLLLVIGFTLLSDIVWSPKSKLFSRTTANVTDTYALDIRPAYWITAIWAFIYAWQAIWLIYSLTCLCRKSKSGYYVYTNPDFLHYAIFIAFIVALWSNIAWIFLWNNMHIGWSLIFILLTTFSLYAALVVAHKKLFDNLTEMHKQGLLKDIRFMRAFVQNGLAFYATWVSIESAFTFAAFVTYHLGAEVSNVCTGALFILLTAIIFYFVLENIFWRQYLIYSFSPWIVLLVTFSSMIRKNWNSNTNSFPTRNSLITLLCLVIICALCLARVVMFILYKTVLKKYFAKFRVNDEKYSKDFVQKTSF